MAMHADANRRRRVVPDRALAWLGVSVLLALRPPDGRMNIVLRCTAFLSSITGHVDVKLVEPVLLNAVRRGMKTLHTELDRHQAPLEERP